MGNQKNLDETVLAFKNFINKHPQIIREIRKSGRSWQEYYEKWVFLGEDDPFWDQFKQEATSSNKDAESKNDNTQLFNQFISMAEKVDLNKMQKQIGELNKTFGIVQQSLNQYLENRQRPKTNERPFHWFRD